MAPAYDVIFAHSPQGAWTAQHQMSINGRFEGISRDDFLLHAERFRVRKPEALLADVRAAVDSFGQFADEAGLKATAWAGIAGEFRVV